MTKKTQNLFENLHLEIKVDIFSRIPLKDLHQCRFVSKDWCQNLRNLFHDPFFVKLHREHNGNLLVLCRTSTDHSHSELYLAECGGDYTSLNVEKICSSSRGEDFEMIDSCNGLVCLASRPLHELFCIFNPVTGETLELPKCIAGGLHPYFIQSGFAFDAITNTYTIVRTSSCYHHVLSPRTRVDLYTLGSGTGTSMWRKIRDDPGLVVVRYKHNQPPVFLHGALHWLEFSGAGAYIEAMDVKSESFCAINLPQMSSLRYLITLRDCLCICDTNSHLTRNGFQLWVMNDYGEATSWTLQHCVLQHVNNPLGFYGRLRLIRRISEGFLLLKYDDHQGYYQYDLEKREINCIVIDGLSSFSHSDRFDAVSHFGSFISPARLDAGSKH